MFYVQKKISKTNIKKNSRHDIILIYSCYVSVPQCNK